MHVRGSWDLCTPRRGVRPWRGRLSLYCRGRTLSRFRLGRRRQRAWPLASPSCRGADPAGGEALAHLQPLPRHGAGAARQAPDGGDFRRQGFFRQFRRRGDGSVHQDGAQISQPSRPSPALPHRHLRGRLSWPHACDHRGRQPAEVSGGLRAEGRGLRSGSAWRPRSGESRDRGGDGRHPDRAAPRRGRRPPRVAASCARWAACDERGILLMLDEVQTRHGPHRQALRL